MNWFKKVQSQLEKADQSNMIKPEPITLSNGETLNAPENLLVYKDAPNLDETEIIGVFAGAQEALRIVILYNPSLIKDVLKIVSDGGPYGKYVPGESELVTKEIEKTRPGLQWQSGQIIHVNISRIVNEAMAKNPQGWYRDAVIETASTIIHEATHANGGGESEAQESEHQFMQWVETQDQQLFNLANDNGQKFNNIRPNNFSQSGDNRDRTAKKKDNR